MSTWAIMPSDSDIVHRLHKYIEKVRTSSGGWRYIYKKPKYKNNSKNSFGLEEHKKWQEQQKKTQEAEGILQKNRTANEQQRKDRLSDKKTLSKNMAPGERQKLLKEMSYKESLLENRDNTTKNAEQNVKNEKFKEDKLEQNYRTTPLGKIEYSAKAGAEIISDFVKNFPTIAKDNIKEASTKVSSSVKNFLNSFSKPKETVKADNSWKKGTYYSPPNSTKSKSSSNNIVTKTMKKDMDNYIKNDYAKDKQKEVKTFSTGLSLGGGIDYKPSYDTKKKSSSSGSSFQIGLNADQNKLDYYKNLEITDSKKKKKKK